MPRGIEPNYMIHDCVICPKTISIKAVTRSGNIKDLTPTQYNKKQTCCSKCKSELIRRRRTGTVRKKKTYKNEKTITYQYILTAMDLFLRGNHLKKK